jgi:hypothetical protein
MQASDVGETHGLLSATVPTESGYQPLKKSNSKAVMWYADSMQFVRQQECWEWSKTKDRNRIDGDSVLWRTMPPDTEDSWVYTA